MSNTVELIKQKAWQSRFFSIPGKLANVPAMLTQEECRMLSWITEHHFKDIGQICDLGSFAGGSTVHLGHGLSKSYPLTANKVHAFDRFRIAEHHKAQFLYSRGVAHFEGEWALPLVKQLLGAYCKFVEFHAGDILEKKMGSRRYRSAIY